MTEVRDNINFKIPKWNTTVFRSSRNTLLDNILDYTDSNLSVGVLNIITTVTSTAKNELMTYTDLQLPARIDKNKAYVTPKATLYYNDTSVSFTVATVTDLTPWDYAFGALYGVDVVLIPAAPDADYLGELIEYSRPLNGFFTAITLITSSPILNHYDILDVGGYQEIFPLSKVEGILKAYPSIVAILKEWSETEEWNNFRDIGYVYVLFPSNNPNDVPPTLTEDEIGRELKAINVCPFYYNTDVFQYVMAAIQYILNFLGIFFDGINIIIIDTDRHSDNTINSDIGRILLQRMATFLFYMNLETAKDAFLLHLSDIKDYKIKNAS